MIGALAAFTLGLALTFWIVRRVPEGWTAVRTADGNLLEPGRLYSSWSRSSFELFPSRINLDKAPLQVRAPGGEVLDGELSLQGEFLPEVAQALSRESQETGSAEQRTRRAAISAVSAALSSREARELVESSPFSLQTPWLRVAGVERGLRVEASQIDLWSVGSLRAVSATLFRRHGAEVADAFLISLMARRPAHPVPICVRGDLARLQGDSGRAEILYLEALELDPTLPGALAVLVAQPDQSAGQLERTDRLLRRALKVQPESIQHLNWLSLVLARRGDPKGAEAALVRALALDPGEPTTGINLSALLNRQGRSQEAIERLHKVLHRHPDHPLALFNLGSVLADLGQLDEALEMFQHAERVSPPSVRLYARLAAVHELRGEMQEAERYRERARTLREERSGPPGGGE
ncbi:MAG: tetratricopeptide repeat protein [Acidobacteriota bacterium]